MKNDTKIHSNKRCGHVGAFVADCSHNYKSVKFIYIVKDGVETLKGVKINDCTAKIGDTICFDGKRLSVERR